MHFGPFHTHHQAPIDLGDARPLVVYDDRQVLPDRRSVSLRWLTGAVLTGITSLGLMGGALVAALHGQYEVAAATIPDLLDNVQDTDTAGGTGTKGDRIVKTAEEYSSRQVIPVNVVTREGDREHIRVRPYVLVSSSLATRKNPQLTDQIPPFNPVNMFSDVQVEPKRLATESIFANAVYGAKVEGEVSISLTAFPENSPEIDLEETPDEADIEKHVRQMARFLADHSVETAASSLVDPGRFDFNLARQPEYARLAVRITPENVSFISKRDDETRFAGMDEKIIPISEDNALMDVLLDNGTTDAEAELILNAFYDAYGIDQLFAGQRLRVAYAPNPQTGRMRPERISLYSDTVHKASVARSDTGAYVKAKAPTTFLADAFAEADRISYGGPTPAVYDSIYQTALEQEMPTPLIDELIRVFSFDVDFNARVQPGDSLELFYAQEDEEANGPPEVLYAALNTGSSTRRFYRFRTPDDGVIDYYDANGQSAKKFLMRKPVSGGRFRSGFGMRRHPIHKYRKMHTGVDWSAPRGTPIMSAGNGTVMKAGWSSGYGRRIEVRHVNGYTTTYSHQTGFAKGIKKGAQVQQGQIIGYVGSTGLSTGPHLHYEVKVNGRYVDPMRIRLPRGRVLEGDILTAFETERLRIDTLLDQARRPSRVAAAQ
jgi:murein DD-endopeptidase MepM/ murein hydrolase activator NlpD